MGLDRLVIRKKNVGDWTIPIEKFEAFLEVTSLRITDEVRKKFQWLTFLQLFCGRFGSNSNELGLKTLQKQHKMQQKHFFQHLRANYCCFHRIPSRNIRSIYLNVGTIGCSKRYFGKRL